VVPTSARLSEVIPGRDNNLSLLRFLAASMVVYAHSFGLLGLTETEPFYRLFEKGMGDFGVDIFFVVSGLLITKSLLGKASLGEFVWARVMRIFPALWLSTFLWVVFAGVLFSPLGPIRFWQQPETWLYVVKNSTMLPGLGSQVDLPFVFANAGPEFNTPLWTLPHELQMYALLAACGVLGVIRYPVLIAGLALGGFANTCLAELGFPVFIDPIRSRFLFFFFVGAVAYLYRDRLLLGSGIVILGGAAALVSALLLDAAVIGRLLLALLTPYLAIWFAYVPHGRIRQFNKLGDYSYGIYILAFPLQLTLSLDAGIDQPMQHFLLSMAAVLPLAALSWHFVENRFLQEPAPAGISRLIRFRRPTSDRSLVDVANS
jgi:peptidoglycan/LPS O-acetylase OafA/YrhL